MRKQQINLMSLKAEKSLLKRPETFKQKGDKRQQSATKHVLREEEGKQAWWKNKHKDSSNSRRIILIAKGCKLQVVKPRPDTEHESRRARKEKEPSKSFVEQPQEEVRRSLLRIANSPGDSSYKFIVGPGNNPDVIRAVMRLRPWWRETSPANTVFNFRWQPLSQNEHFERLDGGRSGTKQIVNHFQFHEELTNKLRLVQNLRAYCEQAGLEILDVCPLTFLVNSRDSEQNELFQFISYFLHNDPRASESKSVSAEYKKILGTESLVASLKKYHWLTRARGKDDAQRKKDIPLEHHDYYFKDQHYIWLLKPGGENRGRGVELFDSLKHLEELIHGFSEQGRPVRKDKSDIPVATVKTGQFVIQKYLQRPLLIQGRKFDIRVWALLTHRLGLYLFREGYLRTSSEPFSLSVGDLFVHLTNNAIQKYSQNYGAFQSGNQLSFKDLEEYLGRAGIPYEGVMDQIRRLTKATFQSAKKKVNHLGRKYSFQVFGLDFMLDEKGKAWLIEVNTNPCIELSSPLLERLVPEMLDQALALTLDAVFPGPEPPAQAKGWQFLQTLSSPSLKRKK